MSTIQRTISSGEECGICLESFSDPRSTPCGHSYCLCCLEKHVKGHNSFSCPMCREGLKVPPGGLKNLTEPVVRRTEKSSSPVKSSLSIDDARNGDFIPSGSATNQTDSQTLGSSNVCSANAQTLNNFYNIAGETIKTTFNMTDIFMSDFAESQELSTKNHKWFVLAKLDKNKRGMPTVVFQLFLKNASLYNNGGGSCSYIFKLNNLQDDRKSVVRTRNVKFTSNQLRYVGSVRIDWGLLSSLQNGFINLSDDITVQCKIVTLDE